MPGSYGLTPTVGYTRMSLLSIRLHVHPYTLGDCMIDS